MTVTPNPNDLPSVLEQLQQAEPDLLRSMLTAFVQALMSADADAACVRSAYPEDQLLIVAATIGYNLIEAVIARSAPAPLRRRPG